MANDQTRQTNGKDNPVDEVSTISQVRELLFGESSRDVDDRLKALTTRLDKQHSETMDRISQLEARLVAVQKEADDNRLSSIEEIGDAITQLGTSVRNLSTARKSG